MVLTQPQNSETPVSQIYIILILLVIVAGAAAGYFFFKRRREGQWLDEAIGSDLLASWQYTAAEWQQAVSDEFSWSKAGRPTEIFIYPSLIYFKSGSRKYFLPLERDDRVVTFAGYLGSEGSPLKLRVRWKVVTYDEYNRQQTRYYKEDYRIPIPSREKEQARKVVEFFKSRLENNLQAYTSVVPDDEPISLFGKDSF
jgi:hypothetical protein